MTLLTLPRWAAVKGLHPPSLRPSLSRDCRRGLNHLAAPPIRYLYATGETVNPAGTAHAARQDSKPRRFSPTSSNVRRLAAGTNFNPDLPFVSFTRITRGQLSPVRQNIAICASTKAEKLVAGIAPLLSRRVEELAVAPKTTFGDTAWHLTGLPPTATSTPTGDAGWHLAPPCNAMVRNLALQHKHDADAIVMALKHAADEMDHHPYVARGQPQSSTGNAWIVTIVCTTHQPPGLSMRDVRLARKVNEIIAPYDILYHSGEPEQSSEDRRVITQARRDMFRSATMRV